MQLRDCVVINQNTIWIMSSKKGEERGYGAHTSLIGLYIGVYVSVQGVYTGVYVGVCRCIHLYIHLYNLYTSKRLFKLGKVMLWKVKGRISLKLSYCFVSIG